MPNPTSRSLWTLCLLLSLTPLALAQPQEPAATGPAAAPAPLTVAVLDFEVHDPSQPELGAQIAEALTAMLAGEPNVQLVERALLDQTLNEHQLNLSGLVEPEQAVQIGRLVGARLLVTGKLFLMGERLFLTVKIIGTETTLVDGLMSKADRDTGIDELVLEVGEQLPARLREVGPRLVAGPAPADPLPRLQAQLADVDLPTVAVVVFEEHYAQRPQQPVDPAVETELKRMLIACGFTVQDVADNELAEWARTAGSGGASAWPQGLEGVDVVVTGEAFSESAGRIGNLVVAVARAELNVIDRQSGTIVLADRATARGVDLADQLAGKKALQKAGATLGTRLLEHFVTALIPQTP